MTKQLLNIVFIITSLTVNAQHDWDSRSWNKKSIGFGCGATGSMTKPVINIMHPFCNQDFDEIRSMLNSAVPANKFLAVFLLEQLNKNKELELTDTELEKIDKIKSSNEVVPVCAGCTYFTEEPLNKLLNQNHQMYEIAKNWFKTHYKIYYKKRR